MVDSQIWAPVVAAIGASGLTVIGTFWIAWWQARGRERAALAEERRGAYSRLIAVSGLIVHSGWMLRVTMEMRTGLGEGFDVATRLRKPLEIAEVDEWLRRDLKPLYEAWSEVWTIGSADAVTVGNQIVDRVGELMEGATRRGEARGGVAARLLGEKWSEEQTKRWLDVVDRLGEDRRALARLARSEVGLEVADFLTGSE